MRTENPKNVPKINLMSNFVFVLDITPAFVLFSVLPKILAFQVIKVLYHKKSLMSRIFHLKKGAEN